MGYQTALGKGCPKGHGHAYKSSMASQTSTSSEFVVHHLQRSKRCWHFYLNFRRPYTDAELEDVEFDWLKLSKARYRAGIKRAHAEKAVCTVSGPLQREAVMAGICAVCRLQKCGHWK